MEEESSEWGKIGEERWRGEKESHPLAWSILLLSGPFLQIRTTLLTNFLFQKILQGLQMKRPCMGTRELELFPSNQHCFAEMLLLSKQHLRKGLS